MTTPVTATGSVPAPAAATPAPAAPVSQAAGRATEARAAVDPKIAEAARGFEGIFMSFLVGEMMRSTLGSTNPMHAGLITEKLGDALAEAGGIGLAAVLEQRLSGAAA